MSLIWRATTASAPMTNSDLDDLRVGMPAAALRSTRDWTIESVAGVVRGLIARAGAHRLLGSVSSPRSLTLACTCCSAISLCLGVHCDLHVVADRKQPFRPKKRIPPEFGKVGTRACLTKGRTAGAGSFPEAAGPGRSPPGFGKSGPWTGRPHLVRERAQHENTRLLQARSETALRESPGAPGAGHRRAGGTARGGRHAGAGGGGQPSRT